MTVDVFLLRYEWMVGKLLYTNPTVKYFELALYAEEAIAKFGGLSSMTALDSVVLAAFQVLKSANRRT